MDNKKFNIPTIPLGEKKMLFVPLNNEGEESSTAVGFFIKNEGEFTGTIDIVGVRDHLEETTPVAVLNFKTKKSITDTIKFLRFYRDNIYKKQFQNDVDPEVK